MSKAGRAISRRNFLKMAGIGYSSLLVTPPKLEGATMLSDYFERLNNGERLGPVEMGQFKEKLNEIENKVSYWSQNGPDTLYAKKMWTQDAFFQNMPMSFMVMDRSTDITIPNNSFTTITGYGTYTPVTGDRVTATNDFFELDTTNGRIYIKQTGRVYAFYVYTSWKENATGYRAARVYQYKGSDGSSISSSTAYRMNGVNGGRTSLGTFIFIPWGGTRGIGDYAELACYQDSGTTVDIEYTAFGAFVLR